MKSFLKKALVRVLGWQVRRLRRKHNFKIIGVVGSIGKTSTKLAIAKVLESDKKVRYQEGNYNDIVSVPLVIFGEKMPPLWNVLEWAKILMKNEIQIFSNFPFDIVVVELGTDGPGQISQFRKYLHLDVAVLTAIAPEHMEFFESLEAVAEEEWSVRFFSDQVLANRDLCQILPKDLDRNQVAFYGKDIDPEYEFEASFVTQVYCASAAVVVAKIFGIPDEKIKRSVAQIKSFSGRMQLLRGIKNSTIIDDTYNASPHAVKLALETLYSFDAPQRIAILGMMNELGKTSPEEHRKVGHLCNPKFLDWVVTIGKDANNFLVPEARAAGCQVYEAKNAADAGEYVAQRVKDGAAILAKGSQNGVFAEEALKPLLADKSDFSKLVRQDRDWLKKKIDFGAK